MRDGTVTCNLIVLRSRDLDRADSFYRALGLSFVRHSHGNGPVHLSSENVGQVFEIYPLTDQVAPTDSTRIGFSVPSVDATYASLMSAGGTSVAPPKDSQWGRRAVVADPDGHRVELTANQPGIVGT
jgi:predicted enzyme related to lactoylglutathione lyase